MSDIEGSIPLTLIYNGQYISREEYLETLTTFELAKLALTLEKDNDRAKIENATFQSFLGRVDPVMTSNVVNAQAEDLLKNWRQSSESSVSNQKNSQDLNRRTRKIDNDISTALTEKTKLSLSLCCEIAMRETEEVTYAKKNSQSLWDHQKDVVESEIEEVNVRMASVAKAALDFYRDIVASAMNEDNNIANTTMERKGSTKKDEISVPNNETNMTPKNEANTKVLSVNNLFATDQLPGNIILSSEKILKYYDQRKLSKEALIEKYKLRNSEIKTQDNRLMTQLRQSDEVFHQVDYDQLLIQNNIHSQRMKGLNDELIQLKLTAAKTSQRLKLFRERLNSAVKDSNSLSIQAKEKINVEQKLSEQCAQAEDQIARALHENKSMEILASQYRVPKVLDYVDIKTGERDLKNQVKSWQHKVELEKKVLNRIKTTLMQLQNWQSKVPDLLKASKGFTGNLADKPDIDERALMLDMVKLQTDAIHLNKRQNWLPSIEI